MVDSSNDRNVHVGGNSTGPIVTGDGNVIGQPASPPQPYGRRKVHPLRLTERGLGTASAIATLFAFGSGYSSIAEALRLLPVGHMHLPGPHWTSPLIPTLAMLLFALLAIGLWAARAVVRHGTQRFSRFAFLPAFAGISDRQGGRRAALVWNAGQCQVPGCGGKLRFFDAPWTYITYTDGRIKVAERRPQAVCVKNPRKHRYEVDTTDTFDLQ